MATVVFPNPLRVLIVSDSPIPPHLTLTPQAVQKRIAHTIAANFEIDADDIYLAQPTFYSRLTAAPARNKHDEYWNVHIDKQAYPAFHYTSLIYLSDHKRQFTGGRFVFIDGSHNKTYATVEPKRGRVLTFTSGRENLHRVERVRSGERTALTISFTCDPARSIGKVIAQEDEVRYNAGPRFQRTYRKEPSDWEIPLQ